MLINSIIAAIKIIIITKAQHNITSPNTNKNGLNITIIANHNASIISPQLIIFVLLF